MTTADGTSGWTATFYNSDPGHGAKPLESMTLPGSRMRLNDEMPEGLADTFWLRIEAYIVAPSSGPFDFGLCVVGGQATLSIDGVEIVDNGFKRKQTPGTSFYGGMSHFTQKRLTVGGGTIEEIGTANLQKGKSHRIDM